MPVFDERAFIARLESANTDQLLHLLTRPAADEDQALRAHFGDERYQRLHVAHLGNEYLATPDVRGTEAIRGGITQYMSHASATLGLGPVNTARRPAPGHGQVDAPCRFGRRNHEMAGS
jgi:hypothetical protein